MSPARPVFQGDVFSEVPFVKARSAGNPDKDPNVALERRLVTVLGYPCDIYANGKLVKVQTVAPVVKADRAGIPPNWDGAFTYFPLPDVLGDGELYAVELRTATNIDASYLRRDRRVCSLSRHGWAIFRQRIALCATRALVPLEALDTIGAPLWNELEAWQRWCEVRGDELGFQVWLDGRDANLSGFTRRQALERGSYTMVRALLEQELAVNQKAVAPAGE